MNSLSLHLQQWYASVKWLTSYGTKFTGQQQH